MVTLIFTSGDDNYTVTVADTYQLSFLEGNDRLKMMTGDVTAFMGEGDDYAELRGGTALLYGESGADHFDVYADNPEVHGGGGNDRIIVRGGNGLEAFGGDGDDRFDFFLPYAFVALHGGAGNDDYFGYGRVVGGTIDGDEGNDYFIGFRAEVAVRGGLGNDIYRALPDAYAGSNFIEAPGEGTDSVQVARGRNYTLPVNIENISVQGFSGSLTPVAATLTGNASNNTINAHLNAETIHGLGGNDRIAAKGGNDIAYGGDGNDYLDGGDGDDTLYGGLGNDTFNGRAGADLMTGDGGDDTYYVDNLSDAVSEGPGAGTDLVRVSVQNYVLPANVENGFVNVDTGLALTGNVLANLLVGRGAQDALYGEGGDDVLNGGGGPDILDGGDGDDRLIDGDGVDVMSGGPGNDTYDVSSDDDLVYEEAGEGIDTVRVLENDYLLPANVENATAFFAGANSLFGNTLANVLTGNEFLNVIEGGSGNDTLTGNGGSDYLDGESGSDDLFGGDGDDTFYGSPGSDDMTGGAGADTHRYTSTSQTSATYYDRILDFDTSSTGDTLDLSGIDANTTVAGNQAFVIVGTPSGNPGELWLTEVGGGKFALRGNTDSDVAMEFLLYLTKLNEFSSFYEYNFVL